MNRETVLTVSIKGIDTESCKVYTDYSFDCESLIVAGSRFSNMNNPNAEVRVECGNYQDVVRTSNGEICNEAARNACDDNENNSLHLAILGSSKSSELVATTTKIKQAVSEIPSVQEYLESMKMMSTLMAIMPDSVKEELIKELDDDEPEMSDFLKRFGR